MEIDGLDANAIASAAEQVPVIDGTDANASASAVEQVTVIDGTDASASATEDAPPPVKGADVHGFMTAKDITALTAPNSTRFRYPQEQFALLLNEELFSPLDNSPLHRPPPGTIRLLHISHLEDFKTTDGYKWIMTKDGKVDESFTFTKKLEGGSVITSYLALCEENEKFARRCYFLEYKTNNPNAKRQEIIRPPIVLVEYNMLSQGYMKMLGKRKKMEGDPEEDRAPHPQLNLLPLTINEMAPLYGPPTRPTIVLVAAAVNGEVGHNLLVGSEVSGFCDGTSLTAEKIQYGVYRCSIPARAAPGEVEFWLCKRGNTDPISGTVTFTYEEE